VVKQGGTGRQWPSQIERGGCHHIQMLNYFLKKLDSIPDGDATLLDRTAVLMGSGMSDGNVHNNYSVPAIIVGGKSLGIRCRT
jgi:hypothetical protein